MKYDWKEINDKLMSEFRIRTLPVAYRYFEKKEDMLSIKELTIPEKQCTPCLAVG